MGADAGAVGPAADRGGERLASGARRIGSLTMLSRLLGLVREQIFALTLGAGIYSDAFLAAFRIPNLLRDLFAEGAMSTAFVPTYVTTLHKDGRPAAQALANRVMSTLTIYLGALAVLGMILPAPIVHLVAAGFSPEKAALCERLVRIMMPFLPAISLAVVAMGALNAEHKYTTPALASSVFNVVAIAGGVGAFLLGVPAGRAVVVWAVCVLAGGLGQLLIQVPPLWRSGFRPRLLPDLRLRDRGTREIATLMAPATLGVAAVQVNVVVNSSFASLVSDGAISWLSYAFRLMQLPIGVFGVAVSITATTHLAEHAARGDWDTLAATLRRGLRMVLFLTVPSTVGLALLGVPIIRLIYQHGRFSPHATAETAHALAGYAVGLVAYASIKVMAPAFYAIRRPRAPVAASLSAVAANLIWNFLTYRRFGHVGLALGTSLAALVNFTVLAVAFQRQVRRLFTRELVVPTVKIVAAAVIMGVACWAISSRLETFHGAGKGVYALKAFLPITVGAAVYFAVARALGVDEAKTLIARLRR
ncbi:MAG TPA: murein biosynthesis integral membrane protein MurJ [Polyangia bacterium]|jgi:putative peptidoglycan lipid II flippase